MQGSQARRMRTCDVRELAALLLAINLFGGKGARILVRSTLAMFRIVKIPLFFGGGRGDPPARGRRAGPRTPAAREND